MFKKIYKVVDMLIYVAWGVLMTIRWFYPKNYPPLDRYCLPVLILFSLSPFIIKKLKLYENWRESALDCALIVVRTALGLFPFILPFEYFVRKFFG